MATTYSFKDLSGAFAHPLAGGFIFAGQIGLGQIVITMNTEKTAHDISSDGSVMVSAVAGDNGQVSVEVQQTSLLHQFLLAWYNLIKTAMNGGDPSQWASAALTLRNVVDGSQHVVTGISPSKVPDKVYTAHGQNITWVLMAADIQSLTA
jgi:hypothetical protein